MHCCAGRAEGGEGGVAAGATAAGTTAGAAGGVGEAALLRQRPPPEGVDWTFGCTVRCRYVLLIHHCRCIPWSVPCTVDVQ